jgi:hypothetical protein
MDDDGIREYSDGSTLTVKRLMSGITDRGMQIAGVRACHLAIPIFDSQKPQSSTWLVLPP